MILLFCAWDHQPAFRAAGDLRSPDVVSGYVVEVDGPTVAVIGRKLAPVEQRMLATIVRNGDRARPIVCEMNSLSTT